MSKGSDINVGSIEEDIKNLEKYIELVIDKNYCECNELNVICYGKYADGSKNVASSIKNILQDYTRQKQINEEHQKINGELRERVKELEEERQLIGIPVRNKRDGAIGIVLHQWKSGSIAVLENINPRVINTHDSWSTLEIITDEIKQTKTKDDSISKQKIKDKIEELTNTKGDFATYIATSERIKVLQELLQESEDK